MMETFYLMPTYLKAQQYNQLSKKKKEKNLLLSGEVEAYQNQLLPMKISNRIKFCKNQIIHNNYN